MIKKLLYKISGRLPCRLIKIDDKPYLERYYVGRIGKRIFYLHRFVSTHPNEPVHDHPFDGLSIVLTGRYLEKKPIIPWGGGNIQGYYHKVIHIINKVPGNSFHAITDVEPETWTLFSHGERYKPWGFLSASSKYSEAKSDSPPDWHKTAPCGNKADREPFKTTRG